VKEQPDMSLTAAVPTTDVQGVIAAGGTTARILDILRQRGVDPARAAFTEDRPDGTAEYQAQVYRQAWENSLHRAGHSDYLRYRLKDLGEEERNFLKTYIDQHVQAREMQRAQSKLPPEKRQHVRPRVLNAILAGSVGAGKTVAAVAAAEYATERGLMARFVSHTKYLSWLRPDGAPSGMTPLQVVEFHERCDVLVLDDTAHEMEAYATNFVRTKTSELITARANSNRPTIFTTNLTSDQIREVLGDAVFSRIGLRAQVWEMTGDDRRAPQEWGKRREQRR
jgi:DNA replication protein DnaC